MPEQLQLLVDSSAFWPAVLATVLGLFIGYLLATLRSQQRIEPLRIENSRLATLLEADQAHFEEQLNTIQTSRHQLGQEFAELSQRALKQNNGLFLRLAEQSLRMQSARASSDLENRQQSIEHLLDPIRDSLKQTEQKLGDIEKERQHAFGALQQQLHQLAGSEVDLRKETRNLVNALRRPDVRGRWGEISLKRLAELSGMIEHCDFEEQVQTRGDARQRPDMVVRLPDHRLLVIDAKTPLDGYLSALDANTPAEEQEALSRHARQMNQRVSELAKKAYWQQFEESPSFVIMFIPGDQFLTAALERQPDLLEKAMAQDVIISTPSSLVALLRAVEFGWRQNRFVDNASEIKTLAESMQHRLGTFTEHLTQLGKSLDTSVSHFNKSVGSLNRQVIPASQKMADLGIQAKKAPQTADTIDQRVRQERQEPPSTT